MVVLSDKICPKCKKRFLSKVSIRGSDFGKYKVTYHHCMKKNGGCGYSLIEPDNGVYVILGNPKVPQFFKQHLKNLIEPQEDST